jgi:hypothetical protein
MITVRKIETWGFEHAIRGMRNPMNSWELSDSVTNAGFDDNGVIIGESNLELMKRLAKAGQPHRKYLRQIFVSMDINAPLYWWKEFDTYKVGTVANSCSTMHTLHKRDLTLCDFSCEELESRAFNLLKENISTINYLRRRYKDTGNKKFWYQMIQLLPSSFMQKRTVTFNYENALNMIEQRENHKLNEWCNFVKVLKELPYMKDLI